MSAPNLDRLRLFVGDLSALIDSTHDEDILVREGGDLLRTLIAHDDWLPHAFAQPDPERYRQYLLHCDGRERFSVVSFVWGPGQATPIHDHTVWGLVGVLRGAELAQRFVRAPNGALCADGEEERLEPGQVDAVSPQRGDIHRVRNAFDDRASISVHVYGANIGAVSRATYAPDGARKPFISGYSNTQMPNLWDRSKTSDLKA